MDGTSRKTIAKFNGLNNVADPFRLTPDWAVQIDNVDISRTSGLQRCDGYTRRSTNTLITGAYATIDQTRLYVIDNGELRSYLPDMTYTVVRTGLTNKYVLFEEVNGTVFYTNGTDFGCIEAADRWRHWGVTPPLSAPTLTFSGGTGLLASGQYSVVCTHVDSSGIESGNGKLVSMISGSGQMNIDNIPQLALHTTNIYATTCNGTVYYLLKENVGTSFSYRDENTLGRELSFFNTNVPRGTVPCYFQGRMLCAEYYPELDQTVIWSSLPLHYHHFRYDQQGLIVPGEVRLLERLENDVKQENLIIGTDRQIWQHDGDALNLMAAYGVVSGSHGVQNYDKMFFWSLRGLCVAMPFKNLTEDKFSVAPGIRASAAVIEKDGMRRYVVALQKGGFVHNKR